MVQVENAYDALPHSGLQHADLVYEYLTEGGITRMTAIYFNPKGGEKIEPVRSARLITLRLQKLYGGVVFYSGASDHVLGLIQSQGVPALNEDSGGGAFFARDPGRPAPHNLYTTGDRLAAGVASLHLTRAYPLPVPHAPAGAGTPATHIEFDLTPAHHSIYSYSAADHAYTYSWDAGPMVDAAVGGAPLKIANVVVLDVAHHDAGYTEDVLGAQGIDYDLQVGGAAKVYSGGVAHAAQWVIPSPDRPIQLTAADGTGLSLAPGLTWISLADPGTPVSVS